MYVHDVCMQKKWSDRLNEVYIDESYMCVDDCSIWCWFDPDDGFQGVAHKWSKCSGVTCMYAG